MINEKNTFDLYLKEIGRFPLLQPDEEIELAQKAQSGDKTARKKLIESNLRFVIVVAKQYQNCGLPLIDLIGYGNAGLINAVDKFDSTRGTRLISFAFSWIRQSILKAIGETSRDIRLPNNKVLELVRSGRLGKVKDVYMSYSRYSIDYAPRVSDPLLGGGALLDIGIYPITYSYRLFGFPRGIHCNGDIVNGADYSDDIVLDYDGFKVRMDVSIVGTKGEVMVIDGSEGTLMNVDYHYGLPAAVKVGDDVEVIQGDRGYNKEFDAVASEIREGLMESRFIPMRFTLDCMRILDECRRQMNLVYPFER